MMSTKWSGIWNNLMTCAQSILVRSSIWFFFFVVWKRDRQWSGKRKRENHLTSRPCRVHHGRGSQDLGRLQGDVWLQEVVRSVSEQEGGTQVTGFHTTQTNVVKRGRKAH